MTSLLKPWSFLFCLSNTGRSPLPSEKKNLVCSLSCLSSALACSRVLPFCHQSSQSQVTLDSDWAPSTFLPFLCYTCKCVHAHSVTQSSLFATPWTGAHHASPSMGFFKQEYWSGLPFPSPEELPDPETEPMSAACPALASRFFTMEPPGKPVIYIFMHIHVYVCINTCMHLFVHLCVHIYTHREKYKYIYMHIHRCICIYAHTENYIYVFIYLSYLYNIECSPCTLVFMFWSPFFLFHFCEGLPQWMHFWVVHLSFVDWSLPFWRLG